MGVIEDPEQCYRAVSSRDSRFDGWFVTAVRTTGIYCRPSCPAITPKRENVSFFASAAAAQRNGYRACKRCRPNATPGSPEWNVRADVVGRAMRLIADGVVDRAGVGGLAERLSYSDRQLNRLLTAEMGAGPLALARMQRAQTARLLIETTTMSFTDVAFAAGFSSVRQFNETVREVFAVSPSELRSRRGREPIGPGVVTVQLAYRQPFDADSVFAFLGVRAVPGIESWDGTTYARVLSLPHGTGTVALSDVPTESAVRCELRLDDWRDLQAAVQRCRRLLDLDADPVAIDGVLGADPAMAPLIARRPGLRSPSHVDGAELAVRAILGQQVSVSGARTLAGRLVHAIGEPLAHPRNGLTHAFPTPGAIADLDPDQLAMPGSRKRALQGMCAAIDRGDVVIDAGADRDELGRRMLALPGIGPWTASYIAMRALADPDVFLPTDIGVRNGLRHIGLDGSPQAAVTASEAWRPWRSYALHHLWANLSEPPSAPTLDLDLDQETTS
ncbi:MAG: transcriptional regulator, AraC family [Ilumatobacteraceae bacterium]|nr:transcriptional regulator, AraC family [Ilumatobacteraceae bacterium]